MVRLKLFGYWYSEREPFYPHPELFVDEDFDSETKEWIVRYLRLCYPLLHYRGFSPCRFNCTSSTPGTSDDSDGEYIFPSGFMHYVQAHSVKPPQEFIEKVLKSIPIIVQKEEDETIIVKRLLREKDDKMKASIEFAVDYNWWI